MRNTPVTGNSGSLTREANSQSDGEVRAEIMRLVDAMTNTGQRSLDDKPVKALKKICRCVCPSLFYSL